nr:hypothetical protein [Tanacetum cinerariifolium]
KSINAKWLSTSKNLLKLVDSSMTARTKRGLGYVNLTSENDWGFGDSKLSVFNSNKEDWEWKPIYNRFMKVNHYKGVPPHMNGNYMPTSTSPNTGESVPTASDSCVESANNVVNDSEDFTSRTSTSGSKEQFDNVYKISKLDIAKDTGIADSGCSRSMSGNRDTLDDFVDFDGGPVRFGGSNGMITGKGTIKTKHLNECLVLSKDFPLPDPSMVILSIPRTQNLYTLSLEELAPQAPITCLLDKASQDESNL